MKLISKYIPVSELRKYNHIFSTEVKTNQIESDFEDWLVDFDRCIEEPSGDINLEYLIECFHEFMEAEIENM